MSELESFGSGDYDAQKTDSTNANADPAASQDPRVAAVQNVYALIASREPGSALTAVKILIAMYAKGYNVVEFAPFVIQQLASPDAKLRHFAQIYVSQYVQDDPDTIMLATNTLQRSLTDSDPIIRACALKTLSSIGLKDALPAIQDAITRMVGDPSPYVKKEVAFSMIKACEIDPDEIDTYRPLLDRLLGDTSPIAFSGAIAAYWSLCPDNIELLHGRFRFMCQNITKFDSFGQVFVLRALTVYCRYCFKAPESESVDESPEAFWIEDGQAAETISADHLAVIHAAKRLLASPTAAVVLAAVAFLFYCAPAQHVTAVAKPLIRLLYETPTTAEISLITILTIAGGYQHVFLPHLNHFFIKRGDPLPVKQLKLRVLTALATTANAESVLNELAIYAGSTDREFAASAVKTMGKTALSNEPIIPVCLLTLLRLMGRAEGVVLAEVVVVLAHILRRKRGTDDEAHALKHLCRRFPFIKDGQARAAVLSIVGDLHETHAEFAPQLLRYIAQNFAEESGEVRLQSLTLAAKLIALGSDPQIPLYLLKVCERDVEFDVRDRARLLLALLESQNTKIQSRVKSLLFPPRKPPNWSALDRSTNYQIGTFSQLFDRPVSGYEPLPEWAEELPDSSVRNVTIKDKHGNLVVVSGVDDAPDEDKVVDFDHFFSDDDGGEAEEEEAATPAEAQEYYSDEQGEYEDEEPPPKPSGRAAPKAPPVVEEDEEGDDDLDDFFS
jgi:AP-3 complex subunit beta